MITEFTARFLKDIKKLNQSQVKTDISEVIKQVQEAASLSEIKNIKKLKGYSTAYRIRVGDYRVGIFVEDNIIDFSRIAHRKEIYKIFP